VRSFWSVFAPSRFLFLRDDDFADEDEYADDSDDNTANNDLYQHGVFDEGERRQGLRMREEISDDRSFLWRRDTFNGRSFCGSDLRSARNRYVNHKRRAIPPISTLRSGTVVD
jgi:hypothetical protein